MSRCRRPHLLSAMFRVLLNSSLNARQILALATAALILFQPTVLVAQRLRVAEARDLKPKAKASGPLAGVSLTTLGTPSTQNFDTLPASGSATWTNDSTIPGWFHARTGTGTTIVANDGSSNAGNLYTYGTGTATDRALGSVGSGNAAIGNLFWGVRLQNNTGATITQLDVSYTGEQWRNSAAAAQTVSFSYLIGSPTVTGSLAEFQSAGVAVPQLDFTSPITGGAAGALNGNLAANRVAISHSITGLSIPNGTEIMLRWSDPDHTGADHGLSIDDFSVTPQGGGAMPSLTINDVSMNEGNAGTTTFTFTVSLSSSTHSGVTFDIATADGTAQDGNPSGEDNDYVPQSLTGQTIPNGSNSYMFSVSVNGDTTTEPNETFFVNVTNVTGATVGDGQGQGTIVNDDVTLTSIHTIQGSTPSGDGASPLAGQVVSTSGIVTLLRTGSNAGNGTANGFFLQVPDADTDADPNTSEGIFVFTSTVPTYSGAMPLGASSPVAVGDRLTVTGNVTEFNGLTEINMVTNISVISTGNPLPTAVTLTPTILDPTVSPTQPQLEKFEGMRMTGTLTTVAPNNNFFEVDTVLSTVSRPFREPGIPVSDPIPSDPSSTANVPQWDENPERLSVDTNGRAGAPNNHYTSNVTFTSMSGPLDFSFGRYRLIPDAAPTASGNMSAVPVPTPVSSEFTIAGFNIENFNNNATQRQKAALGIRDVMRLPDIIGVAEIFDLADLQALRNEVNTIAGTSYEAYLVEADGASEDNDQDVGFLVNTARVQVNSVTQQELPGCDGMAANCNTYINPNTGLAELLNDRPPLVLDANVDPSGANMRVIVVANHLRSFIDIESTAPNGTGTEGGRVRAKRKAQAEFLADLLNDLQTANPTAPVVSVGDYNEYEFNSGYDHSLSVIKGSPAPDADIVVAQSPDFVDPNFANLIEDLPAAERYTFVFEETPQALDHVVVNTIARARNTRIAVARMNSDFPESPATAFATNAAVPERNSDHDALVAYFSLATQQAAGSVIISEFRFRGPGQSMATQPNSLIESSQDNDEFVEIYNNTDSDIAVSTTDGSPGWALVAADGQTRFIIPNGTTIPARGHFLGVNTAGYSLTHYGGPFAASGNNVLLADGMTLAPGYSQNISDGGGIALFRSANSANFTLAERLDAAGYTGVDALYREGAGFPLGGPELTGALDYSFVRSMTRATNGRPKDTGDNVADFIAVNTQGNTGTMRAEVLGNGTGIHHVLGAPGPENLVSPINRNAQFGVAMLDPIVAASGTPNRERNQTSVTNGAFGTMTLRRTITNNTGELVTRLRFRIVEVTTFPPSGPGRADLRALTSMDEMVMVQGNPVLVRGTTVEEPPTQPFGGGWNTSLNVPSVSGGIQGAAKGKVLVEGPGQGTIVLNEPLDNGESINIQFRLGVMTTGSFLFFVNIEASACSPINNQPCFLKPVGK